MIYFLILNIMPNFDKTGPKGKGPNTGQGRGTCVSEDKKTTPKKKIQETPERRCYQCGLDSDPRDSF
jgi:hypothetical protein